MKIALLLLSISFSALGDYAWIPSFQHLFLRTGTEFYKTAENYDRIGDLNDISFQGTAVDIDELRFWVEGDYGFAPDWAAQLKFTYAQADVGPQAGGSSLASVSGMKDFNLGTKWQVKRVFPTITLETSLKLPFYSDVAASNELNLGDGNIDVNFLAHTGFRHRNFFFAVTPGFIWRLGNYSSAFLAQGAVGSRFGPLYGLVHMDYHVSLQETNFYNSSVNLASSDANGAGGSYSRMSESPNSLWFGAKMGVHLTQKYFLEIFMDTSLTGSRSARFLKGGINFFGTFDFYKAEKKRKLKEVPLDSDSNEYLFNQEPIEN